MLLNCLRLLSVKPGTFLAHSLVTAESGVKFQKLES